MIPDIDVCALPKYQHFAVILMVALFEAFLGWFGRTYKIKASSIIEILLQIMLWPIKKLGKLIFRVAFWLLVKQGGENNGHN